MDISHIHANSVTSTNDEAKALVLSGKSAPFLYTADMQTMGKGTHGRSFLSLSGGLYMSLVLPVKSIADSVYYTSVAAVAVALTLYEHEHIDVKIKWINDILLYGKKLAGILCEGVFSDHGEYIVIGIGINCKKTEFPTELRDIAASYDGSDPYILSELIADRIISLLKAEKSSWLLIYRSLCATIGQTVTIGGRDFKAIGIDDEFGLILSDGQETVVKRNTE